jgi:hypothetical protein
MWSAVENSFKGVVIAKLESSFAMVTSETSFVVDPVIGG